MMIFRNPYFFFALFGFKVLPCAPDQTLDLPLNKVEKSRLAGTAYHKSITVNLLPVMQVFHVHTIPQQLKRKVNFLFFPPTNS